MPRTPDQLAGAIAARQLGLITYGQARTRAKMTREHIRARVRAKRWIPLQRLVYLVEGHHRSWEQAVLAAVLQAGDGAVAARETALWLLGVRTPKKPEVIHVLVPRTRKPVVKGAAIRTTRGLAAGDCTTVQGVPCTAGERTLVDLACGPAPADRTDLISWTERLINDGHADRDRLHRLARAMCNGRRGNLDVLVDITREAAEATFRSWLEREGARVLAVAGIPPPEWNVEVRDRRGSVGEVDAVWWAARLIVELDGLTFHRAPDQQRRDRARDRRLVIAGWKVLRYTWLDVVRRPEVIVAEVREALTADAST